MHGPCGQTGAVMPETQLHDFKCIRLARGQVQRMMSVSLKPLEQTRMASPREATLAFAIARVWFSSSANLLILHRYLFVEARHLSLAGATSRGLMWG